MATMSPARCVLLRAVPEQHISRGAKRRYSPESAKDPAGFQQEKRGVRFGGCCTTEAPEFLRVVVMARLLAHSVIRLRAHSERKKPGRLNW